MSVNVGLHVAAMQYRAIRVTTCMDKYPVQQNLTPNRPSRCTHRWTSSVINSRRPSLTVDSTCHVGRTRQVLHTTTDRPLLLFKYHTRQRSACHSQLFKVQSLGESFRENRLAICVYKNSDGSVQAFRCSRHTDRETDRHVTTARLIPAPA